MPIANRRFPEASYLRGGAGDRQPAQATRAYNPAAPARVRPDDRDRRFFDAARAAGQMSQGYAQMADNGVIPNELRGYVGRNEMVAERDRMASYLNRSTGGNPYVMRIKSQTPGGLGKFKGYNEFGEPQYGGAYDPLGINASMKSSPIGRGMDAPAQPALPPDWQGPLQNPAAPQKTRPLTMTGDQIRRWKSNDYSALNNPVGGSDQIRRLNDGIRKNATAPESPETQFDLNGVDIFASLPGGIKRNYPTLPEGMTAERTQAAYEEEQASGRRGPATMYREELTRMRDDERRQASELHAKKVDEARSIMQGYGGKALQDVTQYILNGKTTLPQNMIDNNPSIQSLRDTLMQLPANQREAAWRYLTRMANWRG